MPDLKKAELIEQRVYIPFRAFVSHGVSRASLNWWLVSYTANTAGTQAGANATVRLDLDNEPQPDVVLRIDEERGGEVQGG
jgi:hypothetical protein